VGVVRKDRWLYRLPTSTVRGRGLPGTRVAGLGTFVELEILAPVSKLDAARGVLAAGWRRTWD